MGLKCDVFLLHHDVLHLGEATSLQLALSSFALAKTSFASMKAFTLAKVCFTLAKAFASTKDFFVLAKAFASTKDFFALVNPEAFYLFSL